MNQNNLTNNDELEPKLESAVWAVLSQPVPTQSVDRVKAKAVSVVSTQTEHHLESAHKTPSTFVHKRFSQKLVTAAVLIAASVVYLGLFFWFTDGTASTAYAQAIEKLKSSEAFRYKESIYLVDRQTPVECQVMVAADGRQRRIVNDIVTVQDKAGIARLTLVESSKRATVIDSSVIKPIDVTGPGKWLLELKSRADHPDKELGGQTIDDHRCVGFAINVSQFVYKIWIDVSTNNLFQIEYEGMPKGSPIAKCVMSDFQFDQNFDESLFSTAVPDGYQLTDPVKILQPVGLEQSLVEALQGYTKLSDGKFPKSIVDSGEWAVFLSKSGASTENQGQIAGRLGGAQPYLVTMNKSDYDYLGYGKNVMDPKTIVFWYRNADHKLRAIYNDLSVADIGEIDLPKAP